LILDLIVTVGKNNDLALDKLDLSSQNVVLGVEKEVRNCGYFNFITMIEGTL
jgi:hypothetical protein